MLFVTLSQALVSVALLLVLPGYLTRLAWLRRTPQDGPQDALSFWGESLLFSLIWTGGWGVLLAQAGWFSLARLWLISLAYAGAVGLWLWRRGIPLRPSLAVERGEGIAFLLLILVAGALFLRPHEFIWGGADAGVYVNLGANMARTGSWRIQEPLIAQMAPELYPAMFREQPAPMIPQYIPLPGTYLTDPEAGQVTPQFYPLYPVWLAILYSIGGLRLSLYATPLWGLMGCIMVYLAGRAIFARRVGMLGAAFLACTATQIWFSRYPTSETLTQMLLFGGLYALARHLDQEEGSVWWGALAGLALGQALVSRVDLYVLCLLPVGYALYCRYQGLCWRRYWAFTLPFALCFLYSLLFAYLDSWPYFYNVYNSFLDLAEPMSWLPYGALGVVLLAAAWFIAGRLGRPRARAWLARLGGQGLRIAAVAVALLAVYGYLLRPLLAEPGGIAYYWYGDHQVPYVEPYNMVRLGWYLSPLGLLLSVVGSCLALWRGWSRRSAWLLLIGLLFSVFFLYNSRNNPHHIYVMRRYVPVVIPFLMLMAAYALDHLGAALPRYGRSVSGLLAIGLTAWLLLNARVVIPHIEYEGLIKQFGSFAEALGDGPTVLLFNDARPVGPAATVGTPLRYLEGFTVFDLQEEQLDQPLLAEQIRLWQMAGYRVVMIEGEQATALFADDLTPQHAGQFEFRYPMLETTYEHMPRQIWSVTIPLRFWELPSLPTGSDGATSSGQVPCPYS